MEATKNREIKFRAWDGKHLLCDIHPIDNKTIFELNQYDWGTEKVESIMQYTGLHDKNGNEIYEGDIITASGGRLKSVVEYKKYGFMPLMPKWGERGEEYNDIEVIGNIRENPELLSTTPKSDDRPKE